MPEKQYVDALSHTDRMIVRFVNQGGVIISFSVQYEALIGGRWHKLIRYDSSHGNPHRHIFRPDGTQRLHTLELTDLSVALTYSSKVIRTSFLRIKESYIILMDKDRRKP